MNDLRDLLAKARACGVRFWLLGRRIIVDNPHQCPPELWAALEQPARRRELRNLLRAEMNTPTDATLRPDEIPRFDALAIIKRAEALGVTLHATGNRLVIWPAGRCPPALLRAMQAHKPALIALLRQRRAVLRPDQLPWLHTAWQILGGEFEDADRDTVKMLTITLRGIRHPLCQQALAHLQKTRCLR